MSVVGIDFGAQSTKIGVARNKGIDIVRIMPSPPSALPFFMLFFLSTPPFSLTIEVSRLTVGATQFRLPTKFPTDLLRMSTLVLISHPTPPKLTTSLTAWFSSLSDPILTVCDVQLPGLIRQQM